MRLLMDERLWRGGETVAVFGTFDGVHRGHAQLMERAIALARREGLQSLAYTYSTHPMAVFAPERVPLLLETGPEKVRSVAMHGMDAMVFRPFGEAYAAQTPEAFVQAICQAVHPRYVVVGFNYSFGHKGSGKAEDMRALGQRYGFEAEIVPEVIVEGETVSSTRIRRAIAGGELALAQRLLGRPYAFCARLRQAEDGVRLLTHPRKAMPPEGEYPVMLEGRTCRGMAAVRLQKGRMTLLGAENWPEPVARVCFMA